MKRHSRVTLFAGRKLVSKVGDYFSRSEKESKRSEASSRRQRHSLRHESRRGRQEMQYNAVGGGGASVIAHDMSQRLQAEEGRIWARTRMQVVSWIRPRAKKVKLQARGLVSSGKAKKGLEGEERRARRRFRRNETLASRESQDLRPVALRRQRASDASDQFSRS